MASANRCREIASAAVSSTYTGITSEKQYAPLAALRIPSVINAIDLVPEILQKERVKNAKRMWLSSDQKSSTEFPSTKHSFSDSSQQHPTSRTLAGAKPLLLTSASTSYAPKSSTRSGTEDAPHTAAKRVKRTASTVLNHVEIISLDDTPDDNKAADTCAGASTPLPTDRAHSNVPKGKFSSHIEGNTCNSIKQDTHAKHPLPYPLSFNARRVLHVYWQLPSPKAQTSFIAMLENICACFDGCLNCGQDHSDFLR
ncbi:unnamed protein product [Amoebophrya sp. A25]|nr:unnamed protein product [Amoebophrya sp. A25]|eukprot:GSA25T00027550001.1